MAAWPLLCILTGFFAAGSAVKHRVLNPLDVYFWRDVDGRADLVLAPSIALGEPTAQYLSSFTAGSAEECAITCLDDPNCFVFEHCDAKDGCKQAEPHLEAGMCLLMGSICNVQLEVQAAGPWIKRLAGFPIYYEVPPQPGYEVQLAQGFDGGNFSCPSTLVPGWCAFSTIEEATAACSAMDVCASIVHYQNGTDACSEPLSVLRSVQPSESAGFASPTVHTLIKQSPGRNSSNSAAGNAINSGSSGLSSGAIAGISLGAVSAGAALLGSIALLLQGRQRRHRRNQVNGEGELEHTSSVMEKGDHAAFAIATRPDQHPPGRPVPDFGALIGSRGRVDMEGVLSVHNHSSRRPNAAIMPSRVEVERSAVAASPFTFDADVPFASGLATPLKPPSSLRRTSSDALPASPSQMHEAPSPGRTAADGSVPSNLLHGALVPPCPSPQHAAPALPELEAHVAQQDAASSQAPSSDSSAVVSQKFMSADSLPPALRSCLVDMTAIEYLRWPNGNLQEIGSGASGHVYKALYLGEVVAAKEINIGQSKEAQEAFIREALRLHQLHHPHIVALYGVSLCGHAGIILMEYCAGRDLHSALEINIAGTQDRLFGWYGHGCRVAYEASKALNFLHAKGLVHMDLKSQNVLLTSNGAGKLADVGLARLLKGKYLSDVPLVGTFAWLAPELLLGGQQCTSAVDIFSFGIIMWEIITGERPRRGELRAPRVPEECTQEVTQLMMECVSVDPSRRPTAQQLMTRLGLLCNNIENTLT